MSISYGELYRRIPSPVNEAEQGIMTQGDIFFCCLAILTILVGLTVDEAE